MQIYYSNYKDFYKNPTSADFASDNVSVRELHLNEVISLWGVGNEANGVVEGKTQNNLVIKTKSNDTPNILKIITEDGINHFFYKTTPTRVVNDTTGETGYENNYELNIGDTIVHPGIQKIKQANPNVNFLSKFADRLIFYGRMSELDKTSPLLLPDNNEETIIKAICWVLGESRDYLHDYIKIIEVTATSVKFIGIRKEEDGLYYLANIKPNETIEITWNIDIKDTHKIEDNTQQTELLRYNINVYLQKQFGDTYRGSNPQLVRVKIGDKTESDLYGYNDIDESTYTLTFKHFHDETKTHTETPATLDAKFKRTTNNYQGIAVRGSSLKTWTGDKDGHANVESAIGQEICVLPVNNGRLGSFNSIQNYLFPPSDFSGDAGAQKYFGQSPEPGKVQIDVIDTKSTLTQLYLSDVNPGLLMACAIKNNIATGKFANIGYATGKDDDGDDNDSNMFLFIEANTSIPIKISGLDEKESLEGRIKQIILECTQGLYSGMSEPYLLNPKYFYESITYDNGCNMRFDIQGIDYDIQSEQLTQSGLTIYANVCWTNTEDIYWDFKEMNNELCPDGNNNKTNLRIENIRTCACFGTNANTYLNGSATASYTNYLNNVASYENRMKNFEIDQTRNAFGFIGSEIKDIATGKWGKAVSDGMGGATGIAKSAINLEYENERQSREYQNSINNVKSSANIMVSKPYISSFGQQSGLFTRYANKLQDGEQKNIFANILYHGYIYNSVAPFNSYDNRVIFNKIKLANGLNIEFIEQLLQDGTPYGSIEYAKLIISGLIGGFKLGKPTHIIDMGKAQNNIENILPPAAQQKQNIANIITDTQQYGAINVDDLSFDVGSTNRSILINAIHLLNPETPSELLTALATDTTITGTYKPDIDELTIMCGNNTPLFYGILIFNNLQIIRSQTFMQQFKPFIMKFPYPNQFNTDYFMRNLAKCERVTNLHIDATGGSNPQFTISITDENIININCYIALYNTKIRWEIGYLFEGDINNHCGTFIINPTWQSTQDTTSKNIGQSLKSSILLNDSANALYSFGVIATIQDDHNNPAFNYNMRIAYSLQFNSSSLRLYDAGVSFNIGHGWTTYNLGALGVTKPDRGYKSIVFIKSDGNYVQSLNDMANTDGIGYKITCDNYTGGDYSYQDNGQGYNIIGNTDNTNQIKYYIGNNTTHPDDLFFTDDIIHDAAGTTSGAVNIKFISDEYPNDIITFTLTVQRGQYTTQNIHTKKH